MIDAQISFFEVVKANELQASLDVLYDKYESDKRMGIYFFQYGGSAIPYYIGVGDDIFHRLKAHLENYRWENKGSKYWITKFPEKLASLSCFLDVATDDTFYNPNKNNIDNKFMENSQKLIDNTEFLLANVKTDADVDLSCFKYNVEELLQRNLIKNMGIRTSWIGDGGIGIGKQLPIALDEIHISFDYTHMKNKVYQTLNQKLLLS